MKNKRIYRGMFLSLALIAGCEGVKDSPSSADEIKDSLSSTLTEGTVGPNREDYTGGNVLN